MRAFPAQTRKLHCKCCGSSKWMNTRLKVFLLKIFRLPKATKTEREHHLLTNDLRYIRNRQKSFKKNRRDKSKFYQRMDAFVRSKHLLYIVSLAKLIIVFLVTGFVVFHYLKTYFFTYLVSVSGCLLFLIAFIVYPLVKRLLDYVYRRRL